MALDYLKNHVSYLVDHNDPDETLEFRKLSLYLVSWNFNQGGMVSSNTPGFFKLMNDVFQGRYNLYESLLNYFPESMREPKDCLIDLIPMIWFIKLNKKQNFI